MKTCNACSAPLARNVSLFCRECFFTLPGNERTQLHAMSQRGQDLTSKIAKCVRIIRGKK